jgi:hypothetical protein
MAVKRTVVSGIYASAEQAKRAVADLVAAGFSKEGVVVTAPDQPGMKADGVKLTVHCDESEEITQAKDLLKKTGAQDISSTEETREVFVES